MNTRLTLRLCPFFFLLLTDCERPPQPENRTYHIRKRHVVVVDTNQKRPPKPANPDSSYLEALFSRYNLVDIHSLDSTVQVRLRYSDTLNAYQRAFYDGLRRAYFTCPMAIRLANAQYFLKAYDSTLTLLVLDAARPHHLQRVMWDSVNLRHEKKISYLAHPEATSLHNYGCAVDVTIADVATGKPLDMGTDYDYFSRVSRPDAEKEFIRSGVLTREAVRNRRLLRWVMKRAELKGIASEWWHFSLCSKKEAAEQFPLIE